MKKQSYDFGVKKKYHDELARFIAQFHTKRKNRRALKVVCFPGHEALEIFNVYDQLEIPRENIVGIERDPRVMAELKQQNLGIELFEGWDYQFFEQTNERFDVINLDYQTYLNAGVAYSLALIFGKPSNPIAKDKAIVGVNVLGKRENDNGTMYDQILLSNTVMSLLAKKSIERLSRKSKDHIGDIIKERDMIDEEELREKARVNGEIQERRDLGISELIINKGFEGVLNFDLPAIVRNYALKTFFDFPQTIVRLDRAKTLQEKHVVMYTDSFLDITHSWKESQTQGIIDNIDNPLQRNIMLMLTSLFLGKVSQAYNPYAIERGKYISDNGSPMLYDFLYFKKAGLETNLEALGFSYDSQNCKINYKQQINPRVLYDIDRHECSQIMLDLNKNKFKPRTFLGSSYLPKRKEGEKEGVIIEDDLIENDSPSLEIISLEEAQLLLKAGCTAEEIAACYNGHTLDELLAVDKAVEQRIIVAESIEEKTEDRLEKTAKKETARKEQLTTKEDVYTAITLLREEYGSATVAMFNQNYTCDFRDGQIAAFIKHDTMRAAKKGYLKPVSNDGKLVDDNVDGKNTEEKGKKQQKRKVDSQAVINALASYQSEESVREEFQLSDGQLRAIKAHQTMGTYVPVTQVNYYGAVFEGEGNMRDIFDVVTRLDSRYKGIENIPEIQYKHHRLKRIE